MGLGKPCDHSQYTKLPVSIGWSRTCLLRQDWVGNRTATEHPTDLHCPVPRYPNLHLSQTNTFEWKLAHPRRRIQPKFEPPGSPLGRLHNQIRAKEDPGLCVEQQARWIVGGLWISAHGGGDLE